MKRRGMRVALAVLAVALTPACGGGGGGGGSFPPPAPDNLLVVDASGGAGTQTGSGSGAGGVAGSVLVHSEGNIGAGESEPLLDPPLPAVPTTGTTITSADVLTSYTQVSGTILIPGSVVTGASSVSATCTIMALEGDIVVSGSLQSGEYTGATRGLSLVAPNGTVFVTGTARTTNVDGVSDGNAAGDLTIVARQIVATGVLEAEGEANTGGTGGAGGLVTLSTGISGGTDVLMVGGTIIASGGAGTATGGAGGGITIVAANEARIRGTFTSTGGPASAGVTTITGGAGGSVAVGASGAAFVSATVSTQGGSASGTALSINGGVGGGVILNDSLPGPVSLFGSLDLRGGAATGAATLVGGGAGGTLQIGDSALSGSPGAPAVVTLGVTTIATRSGAGSNLPGDGGTVVFSNNYDLPGGIVFDGSIDASLGDGGTSGDPFPSSVFPRVAFYADRGDIVMSGTVTARGSTTSGDGSESGVVSLVCGNGSASDAGSVYLSGTVDVTGGTSNGATGAGGSGGSVALVCANATGSITIAPGSSIIASGGRAAGSGLGGGAVGMSLVTHRGSIAVYGALRALGGDGGIGGSGGQVEVVSDLDGDGTGGDITLHAGAVIDVSGGSGTTGGGALSGAVPAVIFDADDPDSDAATNGMVLNFGTILARGGVANGSGGDVLFDGLNAAGAVGPSAAEPGGTQDRSGDGTGTTGTFTSQ